MQRKPHRIPGLVTLAGWVATLPFLASTALLLFGGYPRSVVGLTALIAWGSCALAATGALHCGWALRDARPSATRLLAGAATIAFAWIALAFGGQRGLALLAAGFLVILGYDMALSRAGRWPSWYPRLRVPLTGVALACLFAAILGAPEL